MIVCFQHETIHVCVYEDYAMDWWYHRINVYEDYAMDWWYHRINGRFTHVSIMMYTACIIDICLLIIQSASKCILSTDCQPGINSLKNLLNKKKHTSSHIISSSITQCCVWNGFNTAFIGINMCIIYRKMNWLSMIGWLCWLYGIIDGGRINIKQHTTVKIPAFYLLILPLEGPPISHDLWSIESTHQSPFPSQWLFLQLSVNPTDMIVAPMA
jgi:hypothetical protein